jgi:hypothetical protein
MLFLILLALGLTGGVLALEAFFRLAVFLSALIAIVESAR